MEDDDWQLLTWVERGKNRVKVLLYLLKENEPRKPTEISKALDIHLQHSSRTLREMTDNEERPDLVTVINPDAPHSRRYRLTEKGKIIARKLKELEHNS